MNLERGLSRVAAVTSGVVLVVGLSGTLYFWIQQCRDWAETIRQPEGPRIVFLVGLSTATSFPDGTTEGEISKRMAETEQDLLAKAGRRVKAKYPEYADRPDAALGEQIVEKLSPELSKEFVQPGDSYPPSGPISYLYRGARGKERARLFSRKQLLEGSGEHTLPLDVDQAMTKLEGEERLPYGQKPDARVFALMAAATVGAALIPWIIFLVGRWIARGFSST